MKLSGLHSIFDKTILLKKLFALVLFYCRLSTADCQPSYWQQEVNYNIDVALNDKNHRLKGFLKLEYTNNSPDKLDFIWFHLWPNAYKNENTAFAKQILREADGKDRWRGLKDKGYIDSLDFSANGQKLKTEIDVENIDIIKVFLLSPLQSKEKITITTPFFVKLPTYISRSGHIDQSYIICQWYPKPAVYDSKGWHPIPYLDMGEFYSEFGKFTVKITTPSDYVVAATGLMQNADELKYYKELGKQNFATTKNKKYTPITNQPAKTLIYQADSVHDFAWFADKDFIIEYDTMQLASGKRVDVFAYHPSYGNKLWDKSVNYIKDAVRHYSSWVGEYPYPVVQAVEGPKNLSSGGMEYPMITLITSPDAREEKLDAVITHEVGHNWFYSILGSNERDHAWMDEGINTYFQFRYEHEKYRANSIFGDMIPKEVQEKPLDQFDAAVYSALTNIPMEEAIDLPAQDYPNKDEYGIVVYLKTAIWMYLVEALEGRDKLDKGIKDYFTEWKFKHPYPEDFEKALEKSMGKPLDQYFGLLKKTGNLK
jgi:hypothetical protein